ncbi:MAG: hypothetical protein R2850_05370 [Bacteroidia bacterium]
MRLFLQICLVLIFTFGGYAQNDSLVTYKFPNGNISGEGYLKNGLPEGLWKNYFPSGKIKSEGLLSEGKTSGIWKFYFESGYVNLEITYLQGIKNGKRKIYLDSGILNVVDHFVNDVRQGWAEFYNDKGQLKRKVWYDEGKENGMGAEFDPDGRIISLEEFKNGSLIRKTRVNRYDKLKKKTGNWVETDSTFSVSVSTQYENGLKNGLRKFYDASGNLIKLEKYVDDILQTNEKKFKAPPLVPRYAEDGKMISRGAYKDGKPAGMFTFYNQEGIADSIAIFKEGQVLEFGPVDASGRRQGEWKALYETGELKSVGNYLDDLKNGTWNYFFQSESLEQTGKYAMGLPEGNWKWFYENGKILREEFFRKGREEGFSFELFPSGDTLTAGEYSNGDREGRWVFQDGDQKVIGYFAAGEMNGLWSHYYSDGQKSFEGNFREGLADGQQKSWYPGGSLKWKGSCEQGKRIGIWTRYDEAGNPVFSVTYEDGVEKKFNGEKIYPEFFPADYESLIQRNPYIF